MNRRHFMKTSAYAAGGIALGGFALNSKPFIFGSAAMAQSNATDFSREFIVPPLETGIRDGKQIKFKLRLQQGESNFIGKLPTPTLGINSNYLGPVLRAKRGDNASFEINNQLDEVATLHWHGFELPALADGGPHQEIRPGETWQSSFDIIQAASSNWYHSHTHQKTGEQVYHGLAGMFIIDDDFSLNADLPSDYGVDDLPVIIQDRSFNRDGSFEYLGSMPDKMHGMHGDTMLVNGVVTPTLTAQRSLLRLRLLNGSNARTYNLAFNDNKPFVIIAGDGGFLPTAQTVQQISLAPAERAEVLIDLSDGREAILSNRPTPQSSRSGGMMGGGMMGGSNEAFEIMRITAPASTERTKFELPQQLVSLPEWRNGEISQTRQFKLQMQMGPRMMLSNFIGGSPFSISGATMDMDVINHHVKANTVERWVISNNSMLMHPFHVHNTQFLVQSRNGRAISAAESGLKDTIQVFPRESVSLLVPFPEYTDSERPYMYHCHILEHEDRGMMGQFTVEA